MPLSIGLRCSCCEQLYDSRKDKDVIYLFGAEEYALCPVCHQEVTPPYDDDYKRRWTLAVKMLQRKLTARKNEGLPVPVICAFCGKKLCGMTELRLHRNVCSSNSGKGGIRQHPDHWLCYYCLVWVPKSCKQGRHRKECPKGFLPPNHSI